MATEKKYITIRQSGTDQNGTAATSSMTSDAVEFTTNGYWVLNVWFDSLTVSGTNPEFTIEVSNDTDPDSFNALEGADNVTAPEYVTSEFSQWRYFRVVYTPNGATGGTKYFDLILENG